MCEFEVFFNQDVSRALGLTMDQVDVLFIKPTGKDAVLVTFRFLATVGDADTDVNIAPGGADASWLGQRLEDLKVQVQDLSSPLYEGNVTLRTDQTWGVSGTARAPRAKSPYNPYSFRPTSSLSYERCKATHRCSRGWEHYDQSTATPTYVREQSERNQGGALIQCERRRCSISFVLC